jgi:hypothetical protein
MRNPNFKYYQYYKINPVTDEIKNNYVSNGVNANFKIPNISFGFGICLPAGQAGNLFGIW